MHGLSAILGIDCFAGTSYAGRSVGATPVTSARGRDVLDAGGRKMQDALRVCRAESDPVAMHVYVFLNHYTGDWADFLGPQGEDLVRLFDSPELPSARFDAEVVGMLQWDTVVGAGPGYYTLFVGDLQVAARLHAKHMQCVDRFIDTEFDTIPLTLLCFYTSWGMFAFGCDLRWTVDDCAAVKQRTDRKLVGALVTIYTRGRGGRTVSSWKYVSNTLVPFMA